MKHEIERFIDFPERHRTQGKLAGIEWHSAYRDALEVVENNGIVALIGNRGTGKTQMAWEIARNCKLDNLFENKFKDGFTLRKSRPALYRDAMDIFIEIKSTYAPKSEETEKELMSRYENAALLVIDEINVSTGSAFEDSKITHIMDKRYKAMRPTILMGNVDLKQFTIRLGGSVVQRIAQTGIVIECNWKSFRIP